MMRKYIFSVSPEHEVRRRLCGFASSDPSEQGGGDDNGRPGGRLALSGQRAIIPGPSTNQNTETDHRVKVSTARLVTIVV